MVSLEVSDPGGISSRMGEGAKREQDGGVQVLVCAHGLRFVVAPRRHRRTNVVFLRSCDKANVSEPPLPRVFKIETKQTKFRNDSAKDNTNHLILGTSYYRGVGIIPGGGGGTRRREPSTLWLRVAVWQLLLAGDRANYT